MRKFAIAWFIIAALAAIGEIRCIYKVCTCNWQPIDKSEVIYTVSAFTGFGCIVGYIDIEDK